MKTNQQNETIALVDELIETIAKLQKAAVAIKRNAQADNDYDCGPSLVRAIFNIETAIANIK